MWDVVLERSASGAPIISAVECQCGSRDVMQKFSSPVETDSCTLVFICRSCRAVLRIKGFKSPKPCGGTGV